MVTDGPSINVWDALAMAAWVAAAGLIVGDAFAYGGSGMGPLTPFGGFVALVAAVLTSAGVARRSKEEILNQMARVFQSGQDSVRKMR